MSQRAALMARASASSSANLRRANAPEGAQDKIVVTSTFDTAENGVAAIPNAVITRNDTATVQQNGDLQLIKEVSTPTARPGDNVTYTIRYSNRGTTPLSGLVINDVVPQFTTFVGQTNGPLPAGLTGPTFAQNGRFLKWTFGGPLAPGLGGFVTFTVKVNP